MVQQVTQPRADRRRLIRRIAARSLLALGGVITFLCVVLVVAAWNEDRAIERGTGYANAEVVSVSFQRTLVRFQTPDGAEHIPSVGVLYPEALEVGQFVQVEYDQRNPELVRVAGRGAWIAVLPVGTTVLAAWIVLLPVAWWLRRRPGWHVTLDRESGAQV